MNSRDITLTKFIEADSEKRAEEHLRFFAKCAMASSELSTCDRHHVGAAIFDTSTKQLLSVGRNGTKPGHPHCHELCANGELSYEQHRVWSQLNENHAEINALTFLPSECRNGRALAMLVTHKPCMECAKAIRDFNQDNFSQIETVWYIEDWENPEDKDMEVVLTAAGIRLFQTPFSYVGLSFNKVKENKPPRKAK